MRSFSFIFICLLAAVQLFAANQESPDRVNMKDLEIKNGLFYKPNSETAFSGIGFMNYENGSPMWELSYSNGQLHGKAFTYYEDKQLASVYAYQKGQLHGKAITYYKNGQPECEKLFVNGTHQGLQILYDKEGKVKSEVYL